MSEKTRDTESRRAFLKNALAGAGTVVGTSSVAQTASAEERERRDRVTTNDVGFELPADPTNVTTLISGASGGTILPSGTDRQEKRSGIGDIRYEVNDGWYATDVYLEATTGPFGKTTAATCLYYDFEIRGNDHKELEDISIDWDTYFKLTTATLPIPLPFSNNDNSEYNVNEKENQQMRTRNRRRGDDVKPDSARILFKLATTGLGAVQDSDAGTGVGWRLLETDDSGQFSNDPEGMVGGPAFEKTEDSVFPGWDADGSKGGTMGIGPNDPSQLLEPDKTYRFAITAVAHSSGLAQVGSNAMLGPPHHDILTIGYPEISISDI